MVLVCLPQLTVWGEKVVRCDGAWAFVVWLTGRDVICCVVCFAASIGSSPPRRKALRHRDARHRY
eukprot:COSAG02_NODE_19660_length_870_cov_211.303502_1_plen_64_part_01